MQPCSRSRPHGDSKTGSWTSIRNTQTQSRISFQNQEHSSYLLLRSITNPLRVGGGSLADRCWIHLHMTRSLSPRSSTQFLSKLDPYGRLCPVPSLIRLPIHPFIRSSSHPAIPMRTSHAHAHANPTLPKPNLANSVLPDLPNVESLKSENDEDPIARGGLRKVRVMDLEREFPKGRWAPSLTRLWIRVSSLHMVSPRFDKWHLRTCWGKFRGLLGLVGVLLQTDNLSIHMLCMYCTL
jgi:hypothetical protein